MRNAFCHVLAVALLWACWSAPASAHRANESYVYFNVTDASLSGRIEATLADLALVLDLDDNGDGDVDQAEARANLSAIHDHFQGRLRFDVDGIRHDPVFGAVEFLDTAQGTFALLAFDIPTLNATPDQIGMHYEFLFDGPLPTHRGFAIIESSTRTGVEDNESQYSLIFGPGNTDKALRLIGRPFADILLEFVQSGIRHVLGGILPLGFLVVLLLPTVLRREAGAFRPARSFGAAFGHAAALIGLWVIVHTAALALPGAGLAALPMAVAEGTMAAAIVLAALANLRPALPLRPWMAVILFAGAAGLGSGEVLGPLGVDRNAWPVAVLGFDLGLLAALLALAFVIVPLLYVLRHQRLYVPVLVAGLSALIAALAVFFVVERSFNLLGDAKGLLRSLLPGG